MKKFEVSFQRHKSAKSIVLSFFKIKLPKDTKNILDSIINLNDISYIAKKGTVKDALKIIRQKEIWGFCSYHANGIKIIHYWYKPTVHIADVAEVLFHELTHASGIKSEKTAIKYGVFSSLITQILLSRFQNKIKKYFGEKKK